MNENEKPIIMIALTKDFLILLEMGGRIRIYHLWDQVIIIDYANDLGIIKVI
jgi:hypothetical protein